MKQQLTDSFPVSMGAGKFQSSNAIVIAPVDIEKLWAKAVTKLSSLGTTELAQEPDGNSKQQNALRHDKLLGAVHKYQ